MLRQATSPLYGIEKESQRRTPCINEEDNRYTVCRKQDKHLFQQQILNLPKRYVYALVSEK